MWPIRNIVKIYQAITAVNHCFTYQLGVSGNNDPFDPIGQTAEKRVRQMVGTWAEFGLIAPIPFGNALVRLVILIDLSTLTVLLYGYTDRRKQT
jgi:hypothetical protein